MLTDLQPLVLIYCSWVKHIYKFWVRYQLYKSIIDCFSASSFSRSPVLSVIVVIYSLKYLPIKFCNKFSTSEKNILGYFLNIKQYSLDENSSFHKSETWLKPYGNFMLRFPIWFPQCVNHYIVSASLRKVYACGNLTVRVSIWFPQRVNHYIVSGSFRMRKPGRNYIHMLST